MAKVKQSYVGTLNGGTTIGIQLPILVNSGADGSYVIAANQIAWGESEFNGYTFGGTSEGLLSAIENAIDNKTVDLTGYATITEVDSHISSYYNTIITPAINAAVKVHAENATLHITDEERAAWNAAKSSIDAFLNENAVTDEVVNTLKEIQEYIESDGEAAEEMLSKITAAQTRANEAFTYTGNVGAVADDALAYAHQGIADASNAYTYAIYVGGVADDALAYAHQGIADASNAYTYAIYVGGVADEAITIAYSEGERAYIYADSAYTYAGNAYTYAYYVGGVADNAYAKGWAAYSYATTECASLSDRITEIANQGIDKDSVNNIIKDYLSDADLTTDISYNIVHTDVATTKFLTNFSYVRQNDTNDYTFQFTYYEFKMPTAADYWGEYEPSTTEPPIV